MAAAQGRHGIHEEVWALLELIFQDAKQYEESPHAIIDNFSIPFFGSLIRARSGVGCMRTAVADWADAEEVIAGIVAKQLLEGKRMIAVACADSSTGTRKSCHSPMQRS